MVGVGQSFARNLPGGVPVHLVLINKQSHQLGDCNGRVGVIQLRGKSCVKLLQASSLSKMKANHVLQGTGYEEVLLFEAQLFALQWFVIGIEHFGNVLRGHFLFNCAVIVSDVKRGKVERFRRFRTPQTQQTAGVHAVAGNEAVVGNTLDHPLGSPAYTIATLLVLVGFGVAAEFHFEGYFRTGDFPRIAEMQPFVCALDLPAVVDLLIKNAELVANTVANRRYAERC